MFLPLHTIYRGQRNARNGGNIVTVCRSMTMERVLTPGPSQSIHNHSPDGFEWGYPGSGPAQLALAILLDFTQDRDLAELHYQDFKWGYVEGWQVASWQISGAEIVAWLQHNGALISPDLIPGNVVRSK